MTIGTIDVMVHTYNDELHQNMIDWVASRKLKVEKLNLNGSRLSKETHSKILASSAQVVNHAKFTFFDAELWAKVASQCHNLESLCVHSSEVCEEFREVLSNNKNLKHLKLDRYSEDCFDDCKLDDLVCSQLHSIHIGSVSEYRGGISGETILEILGLSPDVLELSLSWCCLTDEELFEIARQCPNLRSFTINDFDPVEDETMAELISLWPQLASFDASEETSDATLLQCASTRPLIHIGLQDCVQITEEALLEVARMQGAHVTSIGLTVDLYSTCAMQKFFGQFTKLSTLSVDFQNEAEEDEEDEEDEGKYCSFSKDLLPLLGGVTELNLLGAATDEVLTAVAAHLPLLKVLYVNSSGMRPIDGLNEVMLKCTHLRSLTLQEKFDSHSYKKMYEKWAKVRPEVMLIREVPRCC